MSTEQHRHHHRHSYHSHSRRKRRERIRQAVTTAIGVWAACMTLLLMYCGIFGIKVWRTSVVIVIAIVTIVSIAIGFYINAYIHRKQIQADA